MSDDQLSRALTTLAQVPCPLGWADVEARATGPDPTLRSGAPPRRRVRRVTVAVAVAAATLTAVGLVATWRVSSPGEDRTRTGPAPTTAAGSTTTAPATRTLRTFPVTAFTGTEYLVWGGEAGDDDVSARADGFAVDMRTGDVRPIPAAPIDPRTGATGVWTGSELIVCCGTGRADGYPADTRSAAAWDPASGRWRPLARPPASVARSFPAAAWTGELMVVVATGPAVATYDPATDRWTEVAAPSAVDRRPEAVWTGTEVVLWDSRYGSGSRPPDGAVADRGWRWAPGRAAWEPLPDLPPGARTELGGIAWSGDEVVVWGLSTDDGRTGVGARWRPGDDRWRPVAPSPQGPVTWFEGTPGSQALGSDPAGGRVLVRPLDDDAADAPAPLYAYDPADDEWTDTGLVVAGFHPTFHVADGVVVVPDEAAPVARPATG